MSRTVCTASHVVSRTVCTSSHVTSNVVCAASHVVETAVCTSSRVVASAVCIIETIYLAILGPRPPETRFIVHSEQSLETVTALVEH